MNSATVSEQVLQLVTFTLDKEEYAVDILNVQEINRITEITKVPNAPDYVEGVINLRGKVIPVLNLRKKFGLFLKDRDDCLCREKNAFQVPVDNGVPFLFRGIDDRELQVKPAGAVDQDVDPARLAHHGFEGALDRGGIGHVAFDKGSVPSPALDFLCGGGAAFLVDIDQKNFCARFGETLGRALSDPEGSAGDDGNLIGEIENSLTHVEHLLLELPLWQMVDGPGFHRLTT